MRILSIHTAYRQPGGEDSVAERERALLEAAGHEVVAYRRSNAEIDRYGARERLGLPARMIWSRDSYRDVVELVRRHAPDVAHVHNTFLIASPAVLHACHRAGVPVVQSLHNPRLACVSANFFRDDRLCTDCLGRLPWPGVLHGCYRDSRAASAAVASMLVAHRILGTWRRTVTRHVVSTRFYRDVSVRMGLPPDRIVIKPHFAPDPGRPERQGPGDYALFVGRLDPEKGVPTMLEAWRRLPGVPLRIRGEGRLEPEVRKWIDARPEADVRLVGRLSRDELHRLMREARLLVWPSRGWYETFGLVAVEAYANGVPVIASRTGVMEEIVRDGITGFHFTCGDPEDLATQVRRAWDQPGETARMGARARKEYEELYTPERNLRLLIDVYDAAIGDGRTRARRTGRRTT